MPKEGLHTATCLPEHGEEFQAVAKLLSPVYMDNAIRHTSGEIPGMAAVWQAMNCRVSICTFSAELSNTGCWGTLMTSPFTFTFPSVMRSSALLLDAMPALAITCEFKR